MLLCMLFFFFSSRRRHTRCGRDWSSDVCSSDLPCQSLPPDGGSRGEEIDKEPICLKAPRFVAPPTASMNSWPGGRLHHHRCNERSAGARGSSDGRGIPGCTGAHALAREDQDHAHQRWV